jgi:hypothetical protein
VLEPPCLRNRGFAPGAAFATLLSGPEGGTRKRADLHHPVRTARCRVGVPGPRGRGTVGLPGMETAIDPVTGEVPGPGEPARRRGGRPAAAPDADPPRTPCRRRTPGDRESGRARPPGIRRTPSGRQGSSGGHGGSPLGLRRSGCRRDRLRDAARRPFASATERDQGVHGRSRLAIVAAFAAFSTSIGVLRPGPGFGIPSNWIVRSSRLSSSIRCVANRPTTR